MKTPEEWQRELDGALEADCEHRPAFLCTPCERECFRRIITAAQREAIEAAAGVTDGFAASADKHNGTLDAFAARTLRLASREIRALLPPVAP